MKALVSALVLGSALTTVVLAEEQVSRPPQTPPAQLQIRQQIASFEGVLESAVRQGTQMLERRLQTSTAGNMVMLAGLTRARGFRLDEYGVVFDVEFPSMRRSMVWSIQELERTSTGKVQAASETTTLSSLQPRLVYQSEITDALVNAILEQAAAIAVAPNEWLTVAARESVVDRRAIPVDPSDTAITIILRVKGSDLQAVRNQTLSREEGRTRIGITSY